jgi:hypothetical protein
MIYYSYRMPPAYDDKLNKGVLSLMTWAPVCMLSFGFWMISNKQLVSNDYVHEFTYSSDIDITSHYWTEVFTSAAYSNNPAMPLLLIFWVVFFGTLTRNPVFGFITRHLKFMRVGDLELDEGLPNYFTTLDEHDREWSIKEEENVDKVMKFKILHKETLDNLHKTKSGKRLLQGVHTYDILANILYVDDFQYFSSDLPDRSKYIIDDDEDEDNDMAQSDLVRMVLNMAFLTEEQAQKFSFDKATYSNQLKKNFTKAFVKNLIQ